MNILLSYCHCQGRWFQSLTLTASARSYSHEFFIFCFSGFRTGLSISALYILDQSLKGNAIDPLTSLTFVMNLHFIASGTVNEQIMDFFWIIPKRSLQRKIIFFRQGIQNRIGKAFLIITGLPSLNYNGTIHNTKALIRNHKIFVKFHLISQSHAVRTRSKGIIKRKTSRFDFLNTDLTIRAGKALTEIQSLSVDNIHHHKTFRQI